MGIRSAEIDNLECLDYRFAVQRLKDQTLLPLTETQIEATQHLYCHEEVRNWRLSDLALEKAKSESYYNNGTDRYKRYYQDVAELKGISKFDVDPRKLDRYLWLGGMWVDFEKRGNTKINQEALRLFQSRHPDCVDAFGKLAEVYHASLESQETHSLLPRRALA